MKRLISTLCVSVTLMLAPSVQADLPDFTGLVKDTAPSVVNISTVQSAPSRGGLEFRTPDGEEIPEIFRHFFRIPEQFGDGGGQRKTPQSLGSGFVISSDGYILTNHHVIKGAEQVIVRLNDRRELEAEVVGSDERSDVALLKIDANNLPAVDIGDSSELEQGEWVLAIGSPFGFDHTVTSGIVSATGRALANENYVPFIQTDVAINPGNSGGPLFNLDGEVVGINSQIYTRSGGFMGLSFAIPIDVAMGVAEQLKSDGYVSRGWLGVVIQEVNKDLAESFGLDKPAGALVAKVLPNSPAEAAGFREGDIIQRFNGKPIVLSSDLPHQVGRLSPGSKVNVELVRSGETRRLKVELGLLPGTNEQARAESSGSVAPSGNRLNIVVADLTDEQKNKWNVRDGVVIQRVMSGAGSAAGLVSGDVITMLNGERVESAHQFASLVRDLPANRSVPMRIVRRGSPLFIPLRLSSKN
ncbi:DegQ family serine endoprotease [Neptunomonas marina]|uniref:Probable periplasmic serine endoprotease DegP-like n=1 Tax=Neptunomonas marina TaxID=1815562 RepID=A0A437Q8L0_9GAMM|nr:DegQ family serine endoprotease [Neptunomonas marina]RVU30816.1 DegQ family serine endoprotease [Neptunomonas marina]